MWQTLIPDLVFEILSHFLPDMKLSVAEPDLFPWYLGHICKQWRGVFVSSTPFWSVLDIDLSLTTATSPRLQCALELTELSLLRSKDHPISFAYVLSTSQPILREPSYCHLILESLVAHSSRWRDAYFKVLAHKMEILYKAKNRLTKLRSFELVLIRHIAEDGTFFPSDIVKQYDDFLQDTPRLTHISLCDITPLKEVNWATVTVLHFDAIPASNSLSGLLSCLTQMNSLVKLGFHGGIEYDIWKDCRPITLPSLKYFITTDATMCTLINTPALEDLDLRNVQVPGIDDDELDTIISRYLPSLLHLRTISIATLRSSDATLIVGYMPAVEHLALWTHALAEALEQLSKYPTIRQLKTLAFEIPCNLTDSEETTILTMITSWKRNHGSDKGIGPFENLTEITIEAPAHFIDCLECHLDRQGVKYSVRECCSNTPDEAPRLEML